MKKEYIVEKNKDGWFVIETIDTDANDVKNGIEGGSGFTIICNCPRLKDARFIAKAMQEARTRRRIK